MNEYASLYCNDNSNKRLSQRLRVEIISSLMKLQLGYDPIASRAQHYLYEKKILQSPASASFHKLGLLLGIILVDEKYIFSCICTRIIILRLFLFIAIGRFSASNSSHGITQVSGNLALHGMSNEILRDGRNRKLFSGFISSHPVRCERITDKRFPRTPELLVRQSLLIAYLYTVGEKHCPVFLF